MYAYLMALYKKILDDGYDFFGLLDELIVAQILYYPLLVLYIIFFT
jgi:hypothetical protein